MKKLFSPIKKLNKMPGILKNKKIIFSTATVVLVLACCYMLWGAKKTEGGYLTAAVQKGTVTNTISATGTIEPVSTVSLGFENSEIINKIHVKVGDHVTIGQLLAEQDTTNLEAALIQSSASLKSTTAKLELLKSGSTQEEIEQAESNVRVAQSGYDTAASNLERNKSLFQSAAISKSDLDQSNDEFVNAEAKLTQAKASLRSLQKGNRAEDIAAAEASVESSQAQFRMAQDDVSGAKMLSPINGIVSAINGAEGQRATANNNNTSGEGFITIISEDLQVDAQINEADIGKLALGQKVELTVNAFANKNFTGIVSSISPQAETVSNVQIYNATIQLDENQKGLMAGMPANITIIVNKHENTLTIPKSAVTYAANNLNKIISTQASAKGIGNTTDPEKAKNTSNITFNSSSGTGNSGAVKEDSQKQQTAILVQDKSGKPVPQQVALGLSDQKNYEILEGLKEGDKVIIGNSGTANSGSTTNSSSSSSSKNNTNSSPFMPAGGGPPR